MKILRIPIQILLLFAVCGLLWSQALAQLGSKRGYTHIAYYEEEFETTVGFPAGTVVALHNLGNTPVNVTAWIEGAHEFSEIFSDPVGPSSDSVTLALLPGTEYPIWIAFHAMQPGYYSTDFIVSDGAVSDTVTITARVRGSTGNFIVDFTTTHEVYTQPGMEIGLQVLVLNLRDSTVNMSASIISDSGFTMTSSSSFTLVPYADAIVSLRFQSATVGSYTAQISVSDGATVEVLTVVVHVTKYNHPHAEFIVQSSEFGANPILLYELLDSLSKTISIVSNTQHDVVVTLKLDNKRDFSISDSVFTLTPGTAAAVTIRYTGALTKETWGTLHIMSANHYVPVFLGTVLPSVLTVGGLDVPRQVDFGVVDTGQMKCLDIAIQNAGSSTVVLSNYMLSGFSNEFSIKTLDSVSIAPGNAGNISVCYTPQGLPFGSAEVLTFDYYHPNSMPSSGQIAVNLTGISNVRIKCPVPSPCVLAWYKDIPIAPVGTEKEFSLYLQNMTDSVLTVSNVDIEKLGQPGVPSGVFGLVAPASIILPPFDPNIANSGLTELAMKYSPKSPVSASGFEDIALLRLQFDRSALCGETELPVFGFPEDTLTRPRKVNPLFPKAMHSSAVVALDGMGDHKIRFFNNLTTSVTVTGVELELGTHFLIGGASLQKLPRTLGPNDEIEFDILFTAVTDDVVNDRLIVHSSHEHLGEPFDVTGAPGTVGIDGIDFIAKSVELTLAPNPSAGAMTIVLDGAAAAFYQVYDVNGRVVLTQHSRKQWIWNGTDANGTNVRPGIYYIRATGIASGGKTFNVVKCAVILE